jgi:hypothetical protein
MLRRELDLLDQTIDRTHALADDRALSRVSDLQGLGSTARTSAPDKAGYGPSNASS